MSPAENFFVAIQGFSSYMLYDTKQLAIAIMLWPTIEFHQNFVSNIIRKIFSVCLSGNYNFDAWLIASQGQKNLSTCLRHHVFDNIVH